MKPTTCIAALCAALLLACPAHAIGFQSERALAAGEVDLQGLLAGLERQRANAILKRDVAALRHLMDRQYLHVDSRGRVRSKTELLSALERDDFHYRSYQVESAEVQELGGGAALVTGNFTSLQSGAKARPFRGRYVHVWVRQSDGWKNTFHQVTGIRPASTPCKCD
jgi:hypothetical protein